MMSQDKLILYVEDNIANRLLVRRVLEASGYTIIEAENAQQTFEIIQRHSPDLILMDINLPDMDGYTLTGQLKQIPQMKAVPIIAMTANAMKGDRELCIEAGMNDYITKPIKRDIVFEMLDKWLCSQT